MQVSSLGSFAAGGEVWWNSHPNNRVAAMVGQFGSKKRNMLRWREPQHWPCIRAAAVDVTQAAQERSELCRHFFKNVVSSAVRGGQSTGQPAEKAFLPACKVLLYCLLKQCEHPSVAQSENGVLENGKTDKDRFEASEL